MQLRQLFHLDRNSQDINFFEFKTIWKFTPGFQVAVISVLYLAMIAYAWFDVKQTGLMFGYPIRISILFVPIYEEILFRGLLIMILLKHYSIKQTMIISSLLFGLWHVKNIFYIDIDYLAKQLIYTTFIFGPVTAWLTLKLKTIWPGVILHYLNNLLAPLSLGIIVALFK